MLDKIPLSRYQLFVLFKYSLYLLVTINAASFIRTDFAAAAATLNNDYSLNDIQTIFSATIDSIAWLLLLLIYELETSIVDDDVLNRGYKWLFYGASLLCYVAIVYAALGYWSKLQMLLNYAPSEIVDLCAQQGQISLMIALDEYVPITVENCAAINLSDLQQLNGKAVVFDPKHYTGWDSIISIAWVDVINSTAWVVVVLQIRLDIILELRGGMSEWLNKINASVKVVAYLTLFAMAVNWSLFSSFIDGWDAFLWLISFFFIEMNLISWQKENQDSSVEQPSHPAS